MRCSNSAFISGVSTAVMSVSMNPGASALTVTPREANSLATDLVNPIKRRLAGRIIALAGVAHQANDGGDVDDPPRTLLEKTPAQRLGKQKSALQIGVQHRVPILLAHAHDQSVARHAGVVDQNIHLARVLRESSPPAAATAAESATSTA